MNNRDWDFPVHDLTITFQKIFNLKFNFINIYPELSNLAPLNFKFLGSISLVARIFTKFQNFRFLRRRNFVVAHAQRGSRGFAVRNLELNFDIVIGTLKNITYSELHFVKISDE